MNDAQMTAKIILSAVDQASGTFRNVMGAADGLAGKLASLAGIAGGGLGFAALAREGVQFAASMEDAQIGIAAVVGSMTEYRDASGRVLTGQRAFNLAMDDSAAVMADLRVRALETKATLGELVEAFQVGVQPLSMAGIKLTEVAEATQRLTQVAGAAGIPLAQLGVELRQFARGDEVRGRLVQVLGYTKETIQELSRSGKLMEDLRKRTDAFAMAAEASAETLTGRWSNLKDAFQQILGLASSGLYERLKDSLKDISSLLVTFGRTESGGLTAAFNPEVVARVRAIADGISEAASRFAELAPVALDFGLSFGKSLADIVGLMSKLPFTETLKLLTDLNEVTGGWAGALYLATKAANALAFALGAPSITALVSGGWAKAVLQGGVVVSFLKDMTAAIVTATGASAGLAAGIASFTTAGLFAAAIWSIGKIVEGLRVTRELLDEIAKADSAEKGEGDAKLNALGRFEKRFDLMGPLTEKQLRAKDTIKEVRASIENDLKEIGKVSDYTAMRYRMLVSDIKEVAPALADINVTKSAKPIRAVGEETDEAGKKAERAEKQFQKLFARLKRSEEEAGLSGLGLSLAKITHEADAQRDALAELAAAGAKVPKDAYDVIASEETAKKAKAVTDALKEQAKAYAGFPSVFKGQFTEPVKETLETLRIDSANRLRDVLADTAASTASVMTATLESLQDNLATFNEDVSRMMSQTWGSALRLFDDVFFSALTGRFEDLGGIFRAFGESILRSWSETLSNMVMRAMQGLDIITGKAKGSGGVTGDAGSAVAGGGVLGYIGAGGAGYGIGSGIGKGGAGNQWGGVVGAVGGYAAATALVTAASTTSAIAAGSALGSVLPIVGTIIGAILGAIVGGLFNKNTEKKFTVYGNSAVTGSGPYGDAVLQQRDAMQGGILDLFRASGEKDMAGKSGWINGILNGAIGSGKWTPHAGSQDDLDKAVERLLGTEVPRLMLHELFGSKQTGKMEDLPGIKGIPEYVKGSFAEDAPIPVMLKGLGITAGRIHEIAGLIDSRDPEEVIQYLNRFVAIVVGFNDLSAAMSKSGGDLLKVVEEEAAKTPLDRFRESGTLISQKIDELGFYSGDEQMKRAEEILSLTRQRYEEELAFVAHIRDVMKEVDASIAAQLKKWDEAGLSRDELLSRRRNDADRTWGKLYAAKTQEEVQRVAQEGQAAAEDLLNILSSKLAELAALASQLEQTRLDFASFGKRDAEGMAAIEQSVAGLFDQITSAATKTGDEQIAALAKVSGSARELYTSMTSMLAAIRQNADELTASIEKQLWGLDYDEKDGAGKAGMIEARINELLARLSTAKTPAEVAAITNEIQSLGGQYVGLFGKDDKNRQAAIDWIRGVLRETETRGLDKYAGMDDELTKLAKEIGAKLGPVVDDIATVSAGLAAEVEKWKGFLRDLRTEADEKLGGWIDAISEANAELARKLNEAGDIFKNAAYAAGRAIDGTGDGSGSGGGKGLTPELQNATLEVGNFADALARATARINGTSGGNTTTETPTSIQTVTVPAPTAREVVPIVRRYYPTLAPVTY